MLMVQQISKDLVCLLACFLQPIHLSGLLGRGFSFPRFICCLVVVADLVLVLSPHLLCSPLPQGNAPDSLAPRDRGAQ